ncbi:Colicin I receptor precursor [Sporomusa ovata DSM 2662]|uniref:TonB-dependent receptor Outer membrane receptor for ferrienterochelin and colicins n=1 Tax=Sporomusa ovata TaxID=2378 RepID=A0A0U1KRX6_9FIRM|nr:TonB-dependent receptor [Sporomusa ovata]EQB24955.1 TonB-dependent receptor [Sporomusa ovata DSM 2662]CQR70152.1 TonB-dependent receptor; Outer membrane receptor for ferrienterochelin and colicins [Sporomusa ovata]
MPHVKSLKKKQAMLCAMVSGALLFQTPAVSYAEEVEEQSQYSFEQVVVTATRTLQATKDIPASVTVITANDIEKMNIQSIDQAFIMAAGVYDARLRGMSSITPMVNMRGVGSQTLVLVDGQPLNDAYIGFVTWSSIPIDSVERIEIVKGTGSTLYGSQAMGGVINIITKNSQQSQASVSSRWETNNTWMHQVAISDKLTDKLSYQLNYEKKSTDGYGSNLAVVSPTQGTGTGSVTGWKRSTTPKGVNNYIVGDMGNSTWNEDNIGGKLIYKFSDNRTLTASILHNKYEFGYGSEHNFLTMNGVSFTGNADVGNGNMITVNDRTFWAQPGGRETNVYTMSYRDGENGWTFSGGLTDTVKNYIIRASNLDGTGRVQDMPSSRLNMDLQKEIRFSPNDLAVFGVHYGKDKMSAQEYYQSNWRDFGSKTGLYNQAAGNASTIAFFGQNEHKFSNKISLTTGLRYDRWSTDGMTQAGPAINPSYYSERSDSAVSPKIALQYTMDQTSSMYLSWGKAFQAPDLYSIYSSSIGNGVPYNILNDPNPDLKPQKITTVELGGKKKLSDKTNLSMAVFHNNITDMIYKRTVGTITRDGNTYTLTHFENTGEGTTNGVEVELSHKVNSIWSAFLNYTQQRPVITKCKANPASEGKIVTYVPEKMLKLGIDYQKEKWHGLLTGNYTSKRYWQDDNSDVVNGVYSSFDPFFVMNIRLKYQWDQHNTIMLGVDNLFDRQYFNYYQAPGRTYALQVTHKF